MKAAWPTKWLLALILLVLASFNSLADSSAILAPDTSILALGKFLQYRTATPDQPYPEQLNADSSGWNTSHDNVISLGYQSTPYWFRARIKTQENIPQQWLLELANPQLDEIQVYLYLNNERVQHWRAGDHLPYDQRAIDSPHFLFPIDLQPNQFYELFIHITNTEAMELPATLYQQQHYTSFSIQRAWIDGIFNGFLIIMAAYSLALFLILLDKAYLYYVAYILSMLLFFMFQQGLLYQYVFPNSPNAQHHSISFISLFIFFSIAFFFSALLELPKKLPHHWLAYKTLLALHGIYCLAFWVLEYQTTMYLMIINTLMATLVAVVSIVKLALNGSRSAQIVIVGWTLLLFFLISFTAAKTGLIYHEFLANYGLRLGISIEILIFSFALSFRINQERKEKEIALMQVNRERNERVRAQELALQREIEANQAKENALQIEIKHRENLQHLVEERTVDLERTLSNLEKANKDLEMLSSQDALTGVYNRRAFDVKLEDCWNQSQRNGQPLSLLIVDIDHFKQINDNKGHLCGDHVLREFSDHLTRMLHRPTDIITRYGGEEFAILLPDTPLHGAEVVADTIVKKAAERDYLWEQQCFHISVSVGISCKHTSATPSAQSLVANADSALYQAKEEGRNRWMSYCTE